MNLENRLENGIYKLLKHAYRLARHIPEKKLLDKSNKEFLDFLATKIMNE